MGTYCMSVISDVSAYRQKRQHTLRAVENMGSWVGRSLCLLRVYYANSVVNVGECSAASTRRTHAAGTLHLLLCERHQREPFGRTGHRMWIEPLPEGTRIYHINQYGAIWASRTVDLLLGKGNSHRGMR